MGLAGLISDNVSSASKAGIPYLTDIQIRGRCSGTQDNTRQRHRAYVLITPHVLQDRGDATVLKQELREKLRKAGLGLPAGAAMLPKGGSENPNGWLGGMRLGRHEG